MGTELLIAAAIEAIAGAIGGHAIGRVLGHRSVNRAVRTIAGIGGGIGVGTLVMAHIGDPIHGNGVVNLTILAVGSLAGGAAVSGIAGEILKT